MPATHLAVVVRDAGEGNRRALIPPPPRVVAATPRAPPLKLDHLATSKRSLALRERPFSEPLGFRNLRYFFYRAVPYGPRGVLSREHTSP